MTIEKYLSDKLTMLYTILIIMVVQAHSTYTSKLNNLAQHNLCKKWWDWAFAEYPTVCSLAYRVTCLPTISRV